MWAGVCTLWIVALTNQQQRVNAKAPDEVVTFHHGNRFSAPGSEHALKARTYYIHANNTILTPTWEPDEVVVVRDGSAPSCRTVLRLGLAK